MNRILPMNKQVAVMLAHCVAFVILACSAERFGQTVGPEFGVSTFVSPYKKVFLNDKSAGTLGNLEELKKQLSDEARLQHSDRPFATYVKADPESSVVEVVYIYSQLRTALGSRNEVFIVRSDNKLPLTESKTSFRPSTVVTTGRAFDFRLPKSDLYGRYSFSPAYSYTDESDPLLLAERINGNSIEIGADGKYAINQALWAVTSGSKVRRRPFAKTDLKREVLRIQSIHPYKWVRIVVNEAIPWSEVESVLKVAENPGGVLIWVVRSKN